MTQEQILWLVIGLVVLIVVIAIIAAVVGRKRRQQREADRASAEHLRRDAARQHDHVAAEAETAQSARLEAEAAEADARRLREEADERERAARESQKSLDEQLRAADRLDPEVETDRDGRRKDGVDPQQSLTGAGSAGAVAGAHAASDQDRDSARHDLHDDGHAPERGGGRQESFHRVGDETAEEHELVERRLAADPSAEPRESVASSAGTSPTTGTAAPAEAGAGRWSDQDGEQVVDPEWDQYGDGTRPPRG